MAQQNSAMKEEQDKETGFTEISNSREVEGLLDTLTRPGAASLLLDRPGGELLPVVVMSIVPDDCVVLDVSAIREVLPALRQGVGLCLLGQGVDGMLRTPVLAVISSEERDGRLRCRCEYPRSLRQFQRRDSFRATLCLGMATGVLLRDVEQPVTVQGDLRDLSMDGCRVELPPHAADVVALDSVPMELELCFPSGARFVIKAVARRRVSDCERGLLSVGFAFWSRTAAQDRQLWFYVREIEREAARRNSAGTTSLLLSPLFQPSPAVPVISLRQGLPCATPMTRRLAPVVGYLDHQILELRNGTAVDSTALSRAADQLLGLLEEDRDALLFALCCLSHESQLVQHSLAVAVRLADLGEVFRIPRELRKALAACALMYDLGKTLLPEAVLNADPRSEQQEREYRNHTRLILPRLDTCRWLARAVLEAVVEGAGERLDGSGYPHQWRGDQLHELARLSAVVVEVDRLGRPTSGEDPMPIDVIHQRLAAAKHQFDARWVQRYFEHFGPLPVGTLLRYPGGELGWVCSLDGAGDPVQVQMTDQELPPGESTLGDVLEGVPLACLGDPVPLAAPTRPGALLY